MVHVYVLVRTRDVDPLTSGSVAPQRGARGVRGSGGRAPRKKFVGRAAKHWICFIIQRALHSSNHHVALHFKL